MPTILLLLAMLIPLQPTLADRIEARRSGLFRLDTELPVTRGIVAAYLGGHPKSGDYFHDSGPLKLDGTLEPDALTGPQWVWDGSRWGIRTNVSRWLALPDAIRSHFTTEATLFMRLRLNLATPIETGNTGLAELKSAVVASSHYPWIDGLGYFSVFRGVRVDSVTLSSSVDRAQPHALTITTRPGSNGYQVWQNNQQVVSATGEPTVEIASGFTDLLTSSLVYFLDGDCYEVLLLNRFVSPSEIYQLSRREFQCVRPLEERYAWVGAEEELPPILGTRTAIRGSDGRRLAVRGSDGARQATRGGDGRRLKISS